MRMHSGEYVGLVGEGKVKPSCQQDVVLAFAAGRIGHVNVTKRILPAQPLIKLGHRAEIERAAVLSGSLRSGKK
jgi:hypothetical protein